MNSERIKYIDVAKGIGILLVILGHNYLKASMPGMEKFIFSFHMPFFFLLSGMLFKPNYPLLVLFKRRFATLIRPYTPLSDSDHPAVIGGQSLNELYITSARKGLDRADLTAYRLRGD